MLHGIAFISTILLLAQDIAVIRVPVRIVSVPTLVFSKENHLIPGLKATDFRVLDNGVPQIISLDIDHPPVSVVIAIQTNLEMRSSVSYIAKVGSVMEAHLVGATGRAAVIAYGDDITVLKPFGTGDMQSAFRGITAKGVESRMIDAGIRAIELLKASPRARARVLLFVGQSTEKGSDSSWADLEQQAEAENISVYALNAGSGSNTAGSPANRDFGWLISILGHKDEKTNPISSLVAGSGGTELHFHRQQELENAIGTLGVELRSAYFLSYYPHPPDVGKHTISVEVLVPGAKTYARPGYMLSPN